MKRDASGKVIDKEYNGDTVAKDWMEWLRVTPNQNYFKIIFPILPSIPYFCTPKPGTPGSGIYEGEGLLRQKPLLTSRQANALCVFVFVCLGQVRCARPFFMSFNGPENEACIGFVRQFAYFCGPFGNGQLLKTGFRKAYLNYLLTLNKHKCLV